MSDERPIAELIGWERQGSQWLAPSGDTYEAPAYTVDDLLAWLHDVKRLDLTDAHWDEMFGYRVTLDENGHIRYGFDDGHPTLLAALEAAVRKVAEQ